VRLVWANARLFNEPGSDICDQANKLSAEFEAGLQTLVGLRSEVSQPLRRGGEAAAAAAATAAGDGDGDGDGVEEALTLRVPAAAGDDDEVEEALTLRVPRASSSRGGGGLTLRIPMASKNNP
jgi:hypothetical protein